LLKNQFIQLQNKFRQFQKPSDFEPKYAKMRQILHDVEQNIYTLEIRSDDPDAIHNQLEHCLVRIIKILFNLFFCFVCLLNRNFIKLYQILNLKLNMLFVLVVLLLKKDKLMN
jgi:hypothetical protein